MFARMACLPRADRFEPEKGSIPTYFGLKEATLAVSTTKKDLVRLVEELPDSELDTARRYLEYLRDTADPLLKKLLHSPEEERELTEPTLAGLAESEEDFKAGFVVFHEELKNEFGL